MAMKDEILAAYHRAIARYRVRTGISYPVTRAHCVNEDGTIADTRVYEPNVVARWSEDANGRIRIRLV